MRKLYEINADIRGLRDQLETYAAEHDGDITGFEFAANVSELEGEREAKLLGIAALLKEMRQDAADKKAVADSIAKTAAAESEAAGVLQRRADRLEDFLLHNLEAGEKFKDSRAEITWRKSTAVIVSVEPEKLPQQFQRVSVAADKKAIGDALKSGETIEGAALEVRQNLQVK